MAQASSVKVDLQNGTDRTVYATWSWTKKNTDSYTVKWYYATGNGIWFLGNETSVTVKQNTYNAPSNATKVKFLVKPVAKTHKVKKKDVAYWTASWSTAKEYAFKANPPTTPSVPTVTINQYNLTAEVDDYDTLNTSIEFYVVKNDSSKVTSGITQKVTNHASFSCSVAAGNTYKVRCRAIRGEEKSEWSEYSQSVGTIPAAPSGITSCKAASSTSVRIDWQSILNASSYNVEYTTNKDWFDSSNQTQSLSVNGNVTHAEIVGLDSGEEWFFRVQAVNDQGESGWCAPVSVIIGKAPSPPTTWSSTTTAIVGEDVTLYWVHNSEDNSSQTYAELELIVDGSSSVITIKNSTEEDEKDKTSFFTLATTSYREGTKIHWRVRTKGITDEYSDWSTQRSIDVYAPPTLELSVTGTVGMIEVLNSFPLNVTALPGPSTQASIGYYLSIVANEAYETVDYMGNEKWVNEGDEVYSKYFDTAATSLTVSISAGDVNLDNNASYTIICSVSMDSGLSTEATYEISVQWEDEQYEPDAEIGIDPDSVAAYIRPYCEDDDGNPVENIVLSVYRREFDGGFTELATGLSSNATFVTDPHPALDYARYRVVAMSTITGAISFYDVPGYPVGEPAVIIQWDEKWTSFDGYEEDEAEEPSWTGSLLRLPYNIDVSDNNNADVTMVEYIGRKHPVSYYGTQIGQTSTWNVEIDKEDEETLFAIRRLAAWMGDVYVREPSGSGYWANAKVSFSQKHQTLTIPITLEITRVEGGI